MQVRSLGREDPLEKDMATHSTILASEIPWIRRAWWTTVHRVLKESDMTWQLTHKVPSAREADIFLYWNACRCIKWVFEGVGELSFPRVSLKISVLFCFLVIWRYLSNQGFPAGSDGKESACNAGDLGSIPGLGRSPEEGCGSLLQYSCLETPHRQRNLASYSPWGSQRVRHDWATKHGTLSD